MVDPNVTTRFNEIYDFTQKALLAFVTAKCRSTSDIGDILQDTYMELYSLLCKRGVDYIRNDKAVVFKIAKQKLARYYSLVEKLRLFVPFVSKNDDGDEILLTDSEADAFLSDIFTVDQLTIDSAKQILKQKTEDVRKAFYLFYEVGLPIPEVSKLLSISESNVKNKIYRTLAELRQLLQ
jgi:RNA polymerase sigma-70 factor (ECF subfamily)